MSQLVNRCAERAEYERAVSDLKDNGVALEKILLWSLAHLERPIVEEDHVTIGYAGFSVEISTRDADRYMPMDRFSLRPAALNKGIGKAHMSRIGQGSLAIVAKRIHWQTPSFNVDAVRLYDRSGPVRKEKFRLF
jgi:hypothetical protein